MRYWLILSERKGKMEEIWFYEMIKDFFSLTAKWVNLFWLVFVKKMGPESYFPLQIASCWSIKTLFFLQFSLVLISNLQFCLHRFTVPGPVQRKLGGKEDRKFMYKQCILAASLFCQVKFLWIVLSFAEISATISSNSGKQATTNPIWNYRRFSKHQYMFLCSTKPSILSFPQSCALLSGQPNFILISKSHSFRGKSLKLHSPVPSKHCFSSYKFTSS